MHDRRGVVWCGVVWYRMVCCAVLLCGVVPSALLCVSSPLSWLWSALRTPCAVSYSLSHGRAPLLLCLHRHPALDLVVLHRRQVPLIRMIRHSIALK